MADGAEQSATVERIDLLECLTVGEPGLAPVPVTLWGIDFSINRYYSPETVFAWVDIQRSNPADLSNEQLDKSNHELMKILLSEDDHDKIDELLEKIGARTVPEMRRVFAYINNLAGLTDRQGNALAL
ncbi:hypothetical protein [Gordonia sp. SND2]|uniref:hypothetical protein n=1 Tax=Gordonia sp. SND2 TaxID=3388659 RepID=UPI00398ADD23